ncbi:MAG: LPS export ABC transporter permease LptG [Desulfobacterales bacterium]|nr:LPS export ABC transporter permease LptG [Desulfobacterales bacterium]
MSIVFKYLTKEIFKYFGMVMAMVITIYIVAGFFEKIDNFIEADLPFSKVISFFLFKIPFISTQIISVGILLAVIVVLGIMSKNNEIIALKSCGMSSYYLLKPILLIGFFFSIFQFFLSDVVVPITISRANKIWLVEVKKNSAVLSKEKNIWIKGNRSIFHIKYYNPSNKTIFGVTLNYFDDNFNLIRRVDAKRGFYKTGKWIFQDFIEQILNVEDGNYKVTLHDERVEQFDFLPDDLKRVVKKSEEMNFKELLAYIRKVESEGYDAAIYRVDLHAKIAFPFVCVIMSLLAVVVSVKIKIKGTMSVSIAFGIGMVFLYWVFYSFCLSLGYGGMLPPFVAAWTANFILLCFGLLALLNAE